MGDRAAMVACGKPASKAGFRHLGPLRIVGTASAVVPTAVPSEARDCARMHTRAVHECVVEAAVVAPTVGGQMTADATIADPQSSAIISNLADSLTRRSIELSVSALGPPPCPFSSVALGSHGRQEPVPSSDVDSALAWNADEEDGDVNSYMLSLGSRVCEALSRTRPRRRQARGERGRGPFRAADQRSGGG